MSGIEDTDKKRIQNMSDFVKDILPSAIKLRMFNGQFVYQVPIEGFKAQDLFTKIEKNKQTMMISDWGINQCSLEDVFTRICELS